MPHINWKSVSYIINYYLTQRTDNRMPDKRGTDNRGSTVVKNLFLIKRSRKNIIAQLMTQYKDINVGLSEQETPINLVFFRVKVLPVNVLPVLLQKYLKNQSTVNVLANFKTKTLKNFLNPVSCVTCVAYHNDGKLEKKH